MPLPYLKPIWVDGQYKAAPDSDYGTAIPVSLPVFSNPIPGINEPYILKQDFVHFLEDWVPLALNTPHFVFSDYYLVEESEKQDIGGGIIKWTRTYAQIPASHEGDPEMANYSFIGMTISLGGGGAQTRTRQPRNVESRPIFDYFMVPSGAITDPITGSNHALTDWADIDSILDMQYVSQGMVGGVTYGGITLPVDILNLAGTVLPTWPTADQYQAMIDDALKNRWGATKTFVKVQDAAVDGSHVAGTIDTGLPANGGSVLGGLIPIEPSRVTRWMGNIYQRMTRYVLAQ